MLALRFAEVLCWYFIFIDKTYSSMTFFHLSNCLFSFPYQQMLVFINIIFILHSPGLIANASIIFNTSSINQYIVRALFMINIATALLQVNLSVNKEYTNSTTFILTHSLVNIDIFWKSQLLYTCSVLNYILTYFYLFSRLNSDHIR